MRPFIFLALCAIATAQEMQPEAESPAKVAMNYLKKYDANEDGAISKSEYSGAAFWKRYDGDQDGKVTAQEIRQMEEMLRKQAQAKAPKRREYFRGLDDFGLHDANADGRFSRNELASFVHDAADRNRDGWLSEEEYKGIDRRPSGDDEKEVDLESYEQQDADHDKKLELGEFGLPKGYMDALDLGSDGHVSKEELIENQIRGWGGVPGRDPDAVLRRMDASGNGELERKEFDGSDRLWNTINGYRPEKEDPTVNRDELERYIDRVKDLRRKANAFMTRYDFNGDGKVTRDEFEGPEGAFARCDSNGDGLVTRADGVE